jgi:hypothetical protein
MLYLEVACNDPDNGIFAERAAQLQIGDAEFEPTHWDSAPRFIDMGGSVRLAGKRWQIEGVTTWYGNWCWNRYLLAKPEITPRWYMVEFVTWLRGRKLFRCTCGESEFYEWFNGSADVAPAEVHRMLGNLT